MSPPGLIIFWSASLSEIYLQRWNIWHSKQYCSGKHTTQINPWHQLCDCSYLHAGLFCTQDCPIHYLVVELSDCCWQLFNTASLCWHHSGCGSRCFSGCQSSVEYSTYLSKHMKEQWGQCLSNRQQLTIQSNNKDTSHHLLLLSFLSVWCISLLITIQPPLLQQNNTWLCTSRDFSIISQHPPFLLQLLRLRFVVMNCQQSLSFDCYCCFLDYYSFGDAVHSPSQIAAHRIECATHKLSFPCPSECVKGRSNQMGNWFFPCFYTLETIDWWSHGIQSCSWPQQIANQIAWNWLVCFHHPKSASLWHEPTVMHK